MAKDYFSPVAEKYAECRPSYPESVALFLAGLAPGRGLAWDCGTGSGQAASLLADHFDRVVATDPSLAQLQHAAAHPRIAYHQGAEADSGLPAASCDLVTTAQAAHWFNLPLFYREVHRVLKPRGVLAVWGYAPIHVDAAIDPVVKAFELGRVGQYWPPGREIATSQYRELPFPYPRMATPEFVMERRWTLQEFLGYVGTWSAVDRCRAAEHRDPVVELAAALQPLWGEGARDIRWPLHMLVGRKEQ